MLLARKEKRWDSVTVVGNSRAVFFSFFYFFFYNYGSRWRETIIKLKYAFQKYYYTLLNLLILCLCLYFLSKKSHHNFYLF